MMGRPDYTGPPLDPSEMAPEPMAEFQRWFDAAVEAGLAEPNTMSLATVSGEHPSLRAVLVKSFDTSGFVFFTNYESRKGRELSANPHAAASFTWLELHRQVRIEGTVARIEEAESDAYYASRPRGAQLAAGISRQSEVISDRAAIESAFEAAAEKFADRPIPRPVHWGGLRLRPEVMEFWQGRPDRLHDRIRYRREDVDWIQERLSP